MKTLNVAIMDIPIPSKMSRLPISDKGFPTPWFVAALPDGTRDFRVADEEKMYMAINRKLCWLCGQPLGVYKAFVLGPMCTITRTTSEPGCHLECAEYAVRACPFLTKPRMRRNEVDMPEGHEDPAGVFLTRNPGVCAIWVSKTFKAWKEQGKILMTVGDPERVLWFAEGRPAKRSEVEASIADGLPVLEGIAEEEGPEAEQDLAAKIRHAETFLPAA